MYRQYKDDPKPLQLKIPWDSNTAKGFGTSLVLMAITLMMSSVMKLDPPKARLIETNTIPIEILSIGDGDGTGVSKGNAQREGERHKGKTPRTNINDAEIAANTQKSDRTSNTDNVNADYINPVDQLSSTENNRNAVRGNDASNVGGRDGSEFGRGLGDKGLGRGLGMGFGDIEWGGGGNRVVLHKSAPKYPDGLNMNATIRIKFKVASDGTVVSMIPLQKGDPTLEKASIDALRQWRFNPLKDDREMEGIITFTFRVS